jgi:hypothetical protein
MLSFASEFSVKHQHPAPAFVNVLRKWILGSPHTAFTSAEVAHFGREGDWAATKGTEHIETLSLATSEGDSMAIRYVRSDTDLEWATSAVFSRTAADTWVGIRVSCESHHPAVRLPPAKKPVLVRTILTELGGGSDGNLRVGDAPLILRDADIDLAAKLIRGEAGSRLPIVYVSAGFLGKHLVDSRKLASDLSGMAHVVVEPNRPFSLRLKLDVEGQNVYGGTVGVYWPEGTGRRSFFLGQEFESSTDLERAIGEEVRSALVNRRPLERCSWSTVKQLASRQAQAALLTAGSRDLAGYAELAKQELNETQNKLDAAEREARRLQAEIRMYEARLSASAGVTVKTGDEQDFFAGEIADIIRDALNDASSRVPEDSRRAHVLAAILAANPDGGEATRMREAIKSLLRGSNSITAKLRRGLEDLGFSIEEGGKHHKIMFRGDDRYTFTLPKSGSDNRGGLNAANDIARLLL